MLGDPTLATAELGAEILASLERYLFRHIGVADIRSNFFARAASERAWAA